MKILIAPDSYKDALSAREAAKAMARGILKALPDAETHCCPMGDGGEGTLDALLAATGAKRHLTQVQDALGRRREAAWGYQIRNYVLHPYSIVKDRRTGAEDSQVQAVLDGKLSIFIRSYLEACARLGREPLPGEAGSDDD